MKINNAGAIMNFEIHKILPYLLPVLTTGIAMVGIFGDTRARDERGRTQLTSVGWISLSILLLLLPASVISNHASRISMEELRKKIWSIDNSLTVSLKKALLLNRATGGISEKVGGIDNKIETSMDQLSRLEITAQSVYERLGSFRDGETLLRRIEEELGTDRGSRASVTGHIDIRLGFEPAGGGPSVKQHIENQIDSYSGVIKSYIGGDFGEAGSTSSLVEHLNRGIGIPDGEGSLSEILVGRMNDSDRAFLERIGVSADGQNLREQVEAKIQESESSIQEHLQESLGLREPNVSLVQYLASAIGGTGESSLYQQLDARFGLGSAEPIVAEISRVCDFDEVAFRISIIEAVSDLLQNGDVRREPSEGGISPVDGAPPPAR